MHLDVTQLKSFYYRTALGRMVQSVIRDALVAHWQPHNMRGQSIVGYGFAAPLLRPYLTDAERIMALMPAPQGVMAWPAGHENLSLLCQELFWPLKAGSVDRLVMLHGLETSERASALLDEVDRVLAPDGKMIVIVPNRNSLWARRDITPFGFGRPYSYSQLTTQLRQSGFRFERKSSLLYFPPSHHRLVRKIGPLFETLGHKSPKALHGGVFVMEVRKQVYAPTRPGLAVQAKTPLRILGPAMPATSLDAKRSKK